MSFFLSIIIPVFNAERYLTQCLESLQTQLSNDCEVVAVDDGSTDRSLEICRKFEKANFRFFTQPNAGPSAARNRALRECSGEYVTFLDADDTLAPGTLLECCKILRQQKAELLLLPVQRIASDDRREMLTAFPRNDMISGAALRRLWCMGDRLVNGYLWGKVYQKTLFDTILIPEDMRFAEDMFVLSDIFVKVQNAVFCSAGAYQYYVRENTPTTGEWSAVKSRQLRKAFLHRWRVAEQNHFPLTEQICAWGAAVELFSGEKKLFPSENWKEYCDVLKNANYSGWQILTAGIPLRKKIGILKNRFRLIK